MKKILLLLAFATVAMGLHAQKTTGNKAPVVALKSAQDSASYAYGIILANAVKRQLNNELNRDMVVTGLSAALRGDSVQLSPEAANRIFGDYTKNAQAKAAEEGKKEGMKFLEENKKRKEVMTTASGLEYEILTKGTGTVSPKPTDKVQVHYHGTLLDGTVFDSSVERGQPATFGLSQVIAGWTEGLQLMKAGDKFKFEIPANLAYGPNSPSPKIPANSTLVFEVELLSIQ